MAGSHGTSGSYAGPPWGCSSSCASSAGSPTSRSTGRRRLQAGRYGGPPQQRLLGRARVVTKAKSLERRYHYEGSEAVRTAHEAATRRLGADHRVMRLDKSACRREAVDRLLFLQARYVASASRLFSAVDVGDEVGIQHLDHEVIDPIFGVLEYVVHQQARAASARALGTAPRCGATRRRARSVITIAFLVGVLLLAGFAFIKLFPRAPRRGRAPRPHRDHRSADRAAQPPAFRRTSPASCSASAAAREHCRCSSSTSMAPEGDQRHLGLQAGDERLQAVAHAIRGTQRGERASYIGGGADFAVVSPARARSARRVRAAAARAGDGDRGHRRGDRPPQPRRGHPRGRPRARQYQRIHQRRPLTEPDMEVAQAEHEHDERPLASALALAVTRTPTRRSLCQTVSPSCAP